MINVIVDQNTANVNVVASKMCPFCGCDPCDCNWGLDELFKNGRSAFSASVASGVSGCFGSSHIPTIEDLRLPDFDSIFNSFGTGTKDSYARSYQSVIIDKNFKVQELVKIISEIDEKLIRNVKIFDLYEGETIPGDKKSVALSVTIQSLEKSLNDQDLENINNLIISTVESTIFKVEKLCNEPSI